MPLKDVTLRQMRKLLATLLLFCVGIMIPAAASPVRVCILELGMKSAQVDSKCCADCDHDSEQPDPCCHDLESLPDSPAPQDPLELPTVIVADLPPLPFVSPVPVLVCLEKFSVSEPIRGPTSPAACRAVLGVWRL